MRGGPRPSHFKHVAINNQDHTAKPRQVVGQMERAQSRGRKEYVVEVDLTTEPLQLVDTSISTRIFSPPSVPALHLPSLSNTEVIHSQPIKQPQPFPSRVDQIPKEYVDKLNRAIEDLHNFESQNARLTSLNVSIQQRNMELQTLVTRLQQQIAERPPANADIHRYRSILEEKESQIRGYCARIKLIEQKLQEYELERKANIILSNYYSSLSQLFGSEELEIDELKRLIQLSVQNSRKYEQLANGLHHQQNEDLQRVLRDLNATTFQKNKLELKLLEINEERQKLIGAREHDSNKLMKANKEVREYRDAIESLKSSNDQLRLQVEKLNHNTMSLGSNRQFERQSLEQQLQFAQRNEEVLKKQTVELRKVVDEYKRTLQETEIAHSRETQQMSTMLAELRQNYYEQNHRMKSSESFEEISNLREELQQAHRTILKLSGNNRSPEPSNFTGTDSRLKLTHQLNQVKMQNIKLSGECDLLNRQVRLSRQQIDQLKRSLEQVRMQSSHSKVSNGSQLGQQLDLERSARRQLEIQLAIKSGQFEFLSGELENYKMRDNQKREGSDQLVDRLRMQLADRQQVVAQLQSQVESLNTDSLAFEGVIAQHRQKIDKLTTECLQLESSAEQRQFLDKQELNRYSVEMTDNLNRMRQLVEQKHSLENQLSDIKYAFEQARQQFQKKLNEKDQQLEEFRMTAQRNGQSLRHSKEESEQRLQAVESELHRLLTDNQLLKTDLTGKTVQLQSYEKNIGAHMQTIQSLQQDMKSKDNTLRNLSAELQSCQTEYLRRHQTHSQEFEQQIAQLQRKLQSADRRTRELEAGLADAISARNSQAHRSQEYNVQLQRLESELASRTSATTNIAEQLELSRNTVRKLEAEASTLLSQKRQCQQELATSESTIRRLELELAQIKRSVGDQSQQLQHAYSNIRKLENQITTVSMQLNEQCLDAQTVSRELSIKNGQLNQKLTEMAIELEGCQSEFGRTKNEMILAHQRVMQLQHDNDTLQSQVRRLRGALEDSSMELRQQLSESDRVYQQKLRQAEKEIGSLREVLNARQIEIVSLKQNLKSVEDEQKARSVSMNINMHELEGRLAHTEQQLRQENARSVNLRRLHDEQVATLTEQLRERQRQREELLQRIASSEQKFLNLRVVYGQVQQAANNYRSQIESIQAYAERKQVEYQQHIHTLETHNQQKLNQFMEKHASLERKISEAMAQSSQDYTRKLTESQSREAELKARYEKEMHQYENRLRELRREMDQLIVKSEDKCKRLQEQFERKQIAQREELARMTNQLLQSNQQERLTQQSKERQLADTQESLQKDLNESKRQLARAAEEQNDMRQRMSLQTLELQSRVQQLRQKLKVAQNRLQETRNQHSARQARLVEQSKILKEQNFSLQAEKIAIVTKLQMANIKIDELESEVNHLRNEVEEARHQQRLQLFEFGTPSREGHLSSSGNFQNYRNHSFLGQGSEDSHSSRQAGQGDLQLLKSAVPEEQTSNRMEVVGSANFSKQQVIYHNRQGLGTADPHINFNYSKYYEENVRQIKSSMVSNSSKVNHSNSPHFSKLQLKNSGIDGQPKKRYDSIIKRNPESPKQGLTFSNNAPNIPKSPKMFPPDQQPTVFKSAISSNNKPQSPSQERHTSLHINSALSTQSLHIESEPSEPVLASKIRFVESRQET